MRPDLVVLPEPCINDDLGLFGAVEPLCIQHFAAQRAIESLVIAIFPGWSRIDLNGLYAYLSQSCLQLFGNKLRAIVRAYVFRLLSVDEQSV